ncbi:efflux RND transporter periplasmic adaptor subunit [Seongchinamella sediminis]|uniref:efflux RND transporter periplasmic adaptor subunit n=1 Tax=Seongchinamella sediminis TaxID=2283635 RepID=UPI0013C35CFD|nr:efflux RND transporter periplasmic adaptor subunit [Seongchinamella sediminis]
MSCFVAVLLTACGDSRPPEAPINRVAAFTVGAAVSLGRYQFHGRVAPADLTRVAFRIEGQITDLPVQAGQRVQSGQVLARIDDTIQAQVLADARAQFELGERQLQRAENLYRRGTLTTARLDQLRAAYRLAAARLQQAEAGLRYTVVRAPFDGVVDHVMKELHEPVSAGETVATVYRTDRTDVLLDLPDSLPARAHEANDLSALKIQARFGGGTEVYDMRLLKASTARNPATEAFEYWLTMPSSGSPFPPGMTVTLSVDLESAGFEAGAAHQVPLTALEAGATRDSFRVWRLVDGVVNPVPVRLGPFTEAGVMVLAGVQAGDRLVTSDHARLRAGEAVATAGGGQ